MITEKKHEERLKNIGLNIKTKYNNAIEDYQKAIECDSEYISAYLSLAIAYEKINDKEEENRIYKKLVELMPDNTDVYNYKAEAEYQVEDYEGAILSYTKSLEINPNQPGVYNNRGIMKRILNQYEEAINDFNKAIASGGPTKMLTTDVLSYKRILVVDDSMTTRSMIKNILLNLGYNVDTATDGSEGLAKLKMNHYDLIISDINMPKMNGYEFVEILRNDEMYMDIPVIVMSSVIKETAKKQFSKLKIDAYIQKDMFNQVFFIDKVKEILSKHHI